MRINWLPEARRWLVVAVLAATWAIGIGKPWWVALAATQPVEVAQRNKSFAVTDARIRAGDTLRFTNEDDFPHQIHVTGPDMNLESPLQDAGQAIEIAFPTAGTFAVRCGVHPRMRMSVHVQ